MEYCTWVLPEGVLLWGLASSGHKGGCAGFLLHSFFLSELAMQF